MRTGTIFERSHVQLHKWIYAMYLMVTSRKGISSMQLAKEIGVTQKTAWFLMGRIREACGGDLDKLSGIIEIDETYVGGKRKNMSNAKRKALKDTGRGPVGKQAVFGMRQRDGQTIAKPISNVDKTTLHSQISRHVEIGSTVYSDDLRAYQGIKNYKRGVVRHSLGEYVGPGDIHTNSIESVWALLKRGLFGIWHHASTKHLYRYVDECTFRLNEGRCQRHTLERLDSLTAKAFQHRITYREFIA